MCNKLSLASLAVVLAVCVSQAMAASSTCSQSYYLNSNGAVTNVAGGSCTGSMCYNYILESQYYASAYYYMSITGCVDVAWSPVSGGSSFMVNDTMCASNSQTIGNYTLTVTCASSWICFAGDSMVESQTRGPVPIEDIHADEMLKAYDHVTGEVVYSRFTTYGHKDGQATSQYVVVETESGHSVKLSPSHMILKNKNEFVPASELKQGDRIVLSDNTESAVKTLSAGMFAGAYAPLTEQGTVFVNGVVASCYADYSSHELAHWFHPVMTKATQFVNAVFFGYKDTTELAQALNVFGIVSSLPFIDNVFSF